MRIFKRDWEVKTTGKGTYEITKDLSIALAEAQISEGLATVFVKHTSCSLVLMENADPTARRDLEQFFEDLVPEDYTHFTHTYEGPDDMPAHVKASMLGSHVMVPLRHGRPLLGTWQGIYLCEHRNHASSRTVVITVQGKTDAG